MTIISDKSNIKFSTVNHMMSDLLLEEARTQQKILVI